MSSNLEIKKVCRWCGKEFIARTTTTGFCSHRCSNLAYKERKLKEFYEQPEYGDSRIALERWYNFVLQAEWHTFSDIREDFPSADYVGNQHYVFNIRGNNYRLVVVIKFTIGRVYIRFVGTHREYDNIDCSISVH